MEPWFYRFARPILKVFISLYRPKIIGRENIPKDGRVVLAGNHTNYLDCVLLISSTKRTVHFLAKDALSKGPLSIIFNNMGIIPVNRKIKDKHALEMAIKALNEDKVIGIFPEGTINRTNDIIMPFKIGAVKMAHDTNSKIVPFSITGKYKLFGGNIKIIFDKPIEVKDEVLDNDNNILMEKVKSLIIEGRGKNE